MPKRIFIDTGTFLALEDESDEHHEDALKFRDEVLREENYEMISSSYILDETLTLIRARLGIQASIDFSRMVRKSKVLNFITVSQELEEKGIRIFESYDDKDFSFTDCVSFALMKEMEIREAFAFDSHFEQMGFVRRPK